jgi:hypothetical protein
VAPTPSSANLLQGGRSQFKKPATLKVAGFFMRSPESFNKTNNIQDFFEPRFFIASRFPHN